MKLTIDEFLKLEKEKHHKEYRKEEHNLQCGMVRWFYVEYPEYKRLLFAVPNGGYRTKTTGALLKAEGVSAGVSDLIFLKMNSIYSYLCVEVKTKTGRQSPEQKKFEEAVNTYGGGKYVVVRSLEQFMNVVNEYLNDGRLD